jgi:YegS/Rv2252/BmrU family lipid kinase
MTRDYLRTAGGLPARSRIMRRMPPPRAWFAVINPAAGAGRAARRWPLLARELSRAGVAFDAVTTQHAGEAVLLTREAVAAGHRRLLAVGGDGILHEIVNGVMSQTAIEPSRILIGAAPLGSGNDWARGRGLPRAASALVRCLVAGRGTPHDVGVLDFPATGSRSHFVNVAGAGFDAHVLERLPARGPRRLAYLFGLLDGLRSFRAPQFTIRAGDRRVDARLLLALLALGPYCGGGMRLAPRASPVDGDLDLVMIGPVRLPWDLPKLRRLFDGRLPEERFVAHSLETSVEIDSIPPVAVEADGQLVGRTPLRAGVLPGAVLALEP